MKNFRLVSLLWLVGGFAIFTLSPSQLKATLWQNAAGGDFGTGTNWLGDAVPGAGDIAQFGPGGTYTATLTTSRTLLGVHLDTVLTNNVQLNLGGSGNTLTLSQNSSGSPA